MNITRKQLTDTARQIFHSDLPSPPCEMSTIGFLTDIALSSLSEGRMLGKGSGRCALWLPEIPHREPTAFEQDFMFDGIIVKFAYCDESNGHGQRQNGREAAVWEHGSEVIPHERLTPVFDSGPSNNWLIMPYQHLFLEDPSQFEHKIQEIFGEFPYNDLSVRDNWGVGHDDRMRCHDYGRCPPDIDSRSSSESLPDVFYTDPDSIRETPATAD